MYHPVYHLKRITIYRTLQYYKKLMKKENNYVYKYNGWKEGS